MATDLDNTMARIAEKCRFLIGRYRAVQAERDDCRAKFASLEDELLKTRKENEQLRSQVEYLKVSATLAPKADDVEKTRAMVADLVRDIDRCITELND